MKSLRFILLLLALVSFPFAYQLAVKVTVADDTPAVGANVSLVTGGIELAMQRADSNGMAYFNVTKGSYFVQLRRYSYPLHVTLVEVDDDKQITLSMRQLVSYASAYGQVSGPASFANTSVAAFAKGEIVKRIGANRDGFYVLSFLPEGNYDLAFESPGFETAKLQAFLPTADFMPVSAKLQRPAPPPEPVVQISSPPQASQYGVVEVLLTKGGLPFASQRIEVETPAGKIYATTDSDGFAKVNAAQGGAYRFVYGNISVSTAVVAKEKPVEQPTQNEPESPQTKLPPQPVSQQQNRQGNADFTLPGIILFALAGLAAIIVLGLVAAKSLMGKKKHGGHKQHGGHETQKEHAGGQGAGEQGENPPEHGASHPHKRKSS